MKDKTPVEPTPDIWLQEHENEGMAKCGCKLLSFAVDNGDGAALYYCPLHETAPDLLKACKAQQKAIDLLFAMLAVKDDDFFPSKSGQPWTALQLGNKAITKAEPPKKTSDGWFD